MFGNADARAAASRGRTPAYTGTAFVFVARADSFEKQGDIADAAGHGADKIESGGKRNRAFNADAADAGFESRKSAKRGGNANRAASIGANAAVTQTGRQRRGRPAAGAARDALKVPGIANRTEVRIVAGDAVCELVQIAFAKENRARIFQRSDHGRIVQGNKIPQNLRTA